MDEYICRKDGLEKVKSSILVPADNEWDSGYNIAMAEMLEFIKQLPAVDVKPVKHGQWICEFYNDVFDVYQADCSACKRESTNKYDKVSESYEYCPHCGARMDGEQNDR